MGDLLGHVWTLDDHTITEVVRLYGEDPERPDRLTLARIEREREEASARLARTRDIAAWQATMARLDAKEETARLPRDQRRLPPSELVAYLRSLPALWSDSGPEGRQALANALFAKVEVMGYQRMEYELTQDAIELGLAAALPPVLAIGAQIGEFDRGERSRTARTDRNVPVSLPLKIALTGSRQSLCDRSIA